MLQSQIYRRIHDKWGNLCRKMCDSAKIFFPGRFFAQSGNFLAYTLVNRFEMIFSV